jgi:hypothetical protein
MVSDYWRRYRKTMCGFDDLCGHQKRSFFRSWCLSNFYSVSLVFILIIILSFFTTALSVPFGQSPLGFSF